MADIAADIESGLTAGRWTMLIAEGECVGKGDNPSAADEVRMRRTGASDELFRIIRSPSCPATEFEPSPALPTSASQEL